MCRYNVSCLFPVITVIILYCCNGYTHAQTKDAHRQYDLAQKFKRTNTDSALVYIDSAFHNAQHQKHSIWLAKVSLFKSLIHRYRGEFDLAIEYGLLARKTYKELQNEHGIAQSNLNLGQYYNAKKDFKKSEACLRATEAYSKVTKKMLVEIVNCRGTGCFLRNDYKNALINYNKAADLAMQVNDEYLRANIQNNIANVYVNQREPEKALPIYRRSLAVYRKLNQHLDELLVLYNIGRHYRSTNELDSSLYYANLCLELGQKVHSLEDITYAYSGLNVTYELMGNYKEALKYNELMHMYADSLQMNANNTQIMQLEADYNQKLDKEIIHKQKRKLQRGKRMRSLMLTAIGTILVFLVLGAFYYRKSRRLNVKLKKLNTEMAEQNKTIDQALHEKDILLKEVHHRVKNSLQIVSSLLNLQEAQLTDPVAIDALRNSKTRIQTIALMHRSLYQRDADLDKVNTANYLTNILNLQLAAFSDEASKPSTRVELENVELSIDQSVPLGLIATELINNSLKHAFKNTEKPEITIKSQVINGQFELSVADNGIGFQSDNFKNHASLGLEIVEALNNQLHGSMDCVSNEKGIIFTILFPVE